MSGGEYSTEETIKMSHALRDIVEYLELQMVYAANPDDSKKFERWLKVLPLLSDIPMDVDSVARKCLLPIRGVLTDYQYITTIETISIELQRAYALPNNDGNLAVKLAREVKASFELFEPLARREMGNSNFSAIVTACEAVLANTSSPDPHATDLALAVAEEMQRGRG